MATGWRLVCGHLLVGHCCGLKSARRGSDKGGGVGVFMGLIRERDAEEAVIEHAFGFAASEVGIALGVEFGLDFGASGPFPEEFFAFAAGGGFEEGEAFLFEENAFGAEVAAAEGDDGIAEVVELLELGLGVAIGGREGVEGGGVAEGNPVGKVSGDGAGESLLGGGGVGVIGGEFEGGATELPVAEAGLFPVGEVLLVDGLALEL